MPLARVELKNEYSLGAVELYRDVNKDDPKEILEGVAVAGLVGVLRQLGDLAEFAAEVFHCLQEDVAVISSRSRKLMARVQRVEAAISPLEKAILAQRSHLHFGYTAGSNWHTRIRYQENHFICSDVPQFIMDSYERCRSPPRLHLLDRFDPGGPGSCLKRYSNPTSLKRASVASVETHVEKTPKYKDRKKKRRSIPRSGVSQDAFSSYSSRTQSTQQNIGVHDFPSQTTSSYEATQTSDMAARSNLYAQNGTDHAETDSRPSYSMQPEELESRESIISPLKSHDNDFIDYAFPEEKVTNEYDDIQISTSQEKASCSSPSIPSDEKVQKLEPMMQFNPDGMTHNNYHHEHEETRDPMLHYAHDIFAEEFANDKKLESSSPTVAFETFSNKAVNSDTVDKIPVHPSNTISPVLKFHDVKLDDIEGETDHFMDALNTIDSESETDTDGTKKKAEYSPMLEHTGAYDGLLVGVENNFDRQSSLEYDDLAKTSPVTAHFEHDLVLPSAKTSIDGTAEDELKAMPSVDEILQLTQRSVDPLNLSSSQGVVAHANGNIPDSTKISQEKGDIDDETNVECISGRVLSSKYDNDRASVPIIDETKTNPELEEHTPKSSNASSFTFWTNGNLLGLQPSKPRDCSLLNSLPHHEETNSSDRYGDEDVRKADGEANLKHITEGQDTESDTCPQSQKSGASFRKLSWKISPADLDIKFGKFGSLLHAHNTISTTDSVTTSGNFISTNSISQAPNKVHGNGNCLSQRFEPGNRFLGIGSNKKLLPGESPISSPSSSPPLECMKLSFQPINVHETSKLKLKFPDGNTFNNGSAKDLFSSFQLVPEASTVPHNVGSDSDDDTFYRTSPSLSDDRHSFRSESNSEQWDSSESPNGKDQELHDALHRISLSESSVSTVPKNVKTTSHEDFSKIHGSQFPSVEKAHEESQSCRSSDTSHSFGEELRNYSNSKDRVKPQFAPAPPPMPPIQWRDMKPNLDFTENKSMKMPEGFKCTTDHKVSTSKISQQPKPAPAPFNHAQISEATTMEKSKHLNFEESNGHSKVNLVRRTDEKEDFLQQIRTRSFNLRPTVTTKTAVPTNESRTNVQVTEILKKANAIRQAVGSDDGEDSYWSDA